MTLREIMESMVSNLDPLTMDDRCTAIVWALAGLSPLTSKEISMKTQLNQRTAIRHLEEHLQLDSIVESTVEVKTMSDDRDQAVQAWKLRDDFVMEHGTAFGIDPSVVSEVRMRITYRRPDIPGGCYAGTLITKGILEGLLGTSPEPEFWDGFWYESMTGVNWKKREPLDLTAGEEAH